MRKELKDSLLFLLDIFFFLFWIPTTPPVLSLFINKSNWNFVLLFTLIINLLVFLYGIYRLVTIFNKSRFRNKNVIIYIVLIVLYSLIAINFVRDLSSGISNFKGECTRSLYLGRYGFETYSLEFTDSSGKHSLLVGSNTNNSLTDKNHIQNNSCSKKIDLIYLPNTNTILELNIDN